MLVACALAGRTTLFALRLLRIYERSLPSTYMQLCTNVLHHLSSIIIGPSIPSSSSKGGNEITVSGEKVWVILCLATLCHCCTIRIASGLSSPESSPFLLPLPGACTHRCFLLGFHDKNFDSSIHGLECRHHTLRNAVGHQLIISSYWSFEFYHYSFTSFALELCLPPHNLFRGSISCLMLWNFRSEFFDGFFLLGVSSYVPSFLTALQAFMRGLLLCYDVLSTGAKILISLEEKSLWKTAFQCLCGYCGLPDMLRTRLALSLFLRSLLMLGVPDSECCEASSKAALEACPSLARFAHFLAYSNGVATWGWLKRSLAR
ncbi:hypothetical protein Tco_0920025 [Tanacetum coccineum]